jgi:ABC-type uncharacterized transport system fused permease/ATPase subunit
MISDLLPFRSKTNSIFMLRSITNRLNCITYSICSNNLEVSNYERQ